MAWPASGDAVIAEADDMREASLLMFSDIAKFAKRAEIISIALIPIEYVPDPEWVDPGDGSSPEQVPSKYDTNITVIAGGDFAAANAAKLIEVKEALGL